MSDDNPFTGSEWKGYAAAVQENMVPKMRESAYVMSLVPGDGEADVKFAVELGFAIMMDKPIILVMQPRQRIPEHLRKVADGFIDWSDDPAVMAKRIERMMKKIKP